MKKLKPSERIQQIFQDLVKNSATEIFEELLYMKAVIQYLDERHDEYIKAGGEDQFT